MGPIIIFDKSTLQSLSLDEAVLLDHFYDSNITPVFFAEVLADLEKQVAKGKTPEVIVGSLAEKTPDMNAKSNLLYTTLLEGDLAGATLDLHIGRPHIGGGKRVELDGKAGVIFQQSPEEEALLRWKKRQFLDVERLYAKAWRRNLSNIDLKKYGEFFQKFFPICKPKSLIEVKTLVDFQMNQSDQEKILLFGLNLVGLTDVAKSKVIQRWRTCGKPNISKFAPYFYYVFSVDFFFYIAMAASLIGDGRPSHKIDISYLYYLPFCMVFTSNDKLHAQVVPFFLRENQTFITGEELKADLSRLDDYYSSLPEATKARGLTMFAKSPPDDLSYLITRLWDTHLNPKSRKRESSLETSEMDPKLLERIKQLEQQEDKTDVDPLNYNQPNEVLFTKMVPIKKGKWTRFPPEVTQTIDPNKAG